MQSAAREAQEAEEEVERIVSNMARTAVIAADAFSGVPLQPKRVRLYKKRQGSLLLAPDSKCSLHQN